jgi:hypothetical protein
MQLYLNAVISEENSIPVNQTHMPTIRTKNL